MLCLPVQVLAHLLAWPHDVGSLLGAHIGTSLFFVGTNPVDFVPAVC